MVTVVIGIFLVLHGLVHLLYFALSRKLFELDPPLVGWPEQSWVFSNFFDAVNTRTLASGLYIMATVIFVISGIGYLFDVNWWSSMLIGSGIFSSAVIFLFWDGKFQQLPDKGFVGILINVIILGAVVMLNRGVIAF